jgi:hypothetical protein
MQIGDQLGVAVLAVLGTLVAKRFSIPDRLVALIPTMLSILIVWIWLFDRLESVWVVLGNGTVSGLLASGFMFIVLGISSKR